MSSLDGFSILSRRRLLKLGLGAGGVVLMGGAGVWALRGQAPAVTGLRMLSDHEHRTLSRLAEVAVPGCDPALLARTFDGFLADEPPWNIEDLKRALLLLEYGPLLFDRRLSTFSNLDPAARLLHFESWTLSSTHLRRVVATAFRKFLLLVFYDTPSAWPAIGYDGPLIRAPETP